MHDESPLEPSEPSDPADRLDRRQLMKVTGAAALAAALAELLPGSFLLRVARAQDVPNAVVHLGSVAKGAAYEAVKQKIRAALQATRDLSVIKAGDLAVIKVVSNSPYKYPMVTHPWALQAVIEIVKERTTNVRVVDQVGFEHAFFTGDSQQREKVQALWKRFAPRLLISREQQVASGMEALERNGLKGVAEAGGAEVFSGDHDADYIQVPNGDPQFGQDGDPEFAHWGPWTDLEGKPHPRGFRVNKHALGFAQGALPKKPPHVISISRISAHVWAGTTGPTKAYYGWIHPQDRVRSHTDIDPTSNTPVARDGKLVPGLLPHPEVRHQAERITEVAAFFQRYFERARATSYYANLVVALDTYSDVGPDWGVVPLPEGGVVGASQDVVALDAVTTALLIDYIRSVPESQRAAPAEGEKWKLWDLLNGNSDRWWNAKQERIYRATRGEWNTFFGAAPWVAQLDAQNEHPSVWNVGQVGRGLEIGMAQGMQVQLLDPQAGLTPSQAALLAGKPERDPSTGFLRRLGEGNEGGRR